MHRGIPLALLCAAAFGGCITDPTDFPILIGSDATTSVSFDVWLNTTKGAVGWHRDGTLQPGETLDLGNFKGNRLSCYTLTVQTSVGRYDGGPCAIGNSYHRLDIMIDDDGVDLSALVS